MFIKNYIISKETVQTEFKLYLPNNGNILLAGKSKFPSLLVQMNSIFNDFGF